MTYTHCRDGMMFIQPADQDKLIRLSGTARRIWEMLDYPISIEETAKILAAEYSEEIEIITRETAAFITSTKSLFKRMKMGCVSGSPMRQLNSRVLGWPLASIISPAYKKPV